MPNKTLDRKTLQKLAAKRKRKKLKKALIRHSILLVNLIVVGLAVFMIIKNSNSNAANIGNNVNSDEYKSNPLDRLSAADIAVNIARMTDLSETAAVTNYADTINSELDSFVVSKDIALIPQIITSDIKTLADIREYITVEGDTVAKLSEKFGVTSDSIRWSNDLTSDQLPVGMKLLIPPMNGIIYVIHSGDTAERIAGLYGVSVEQIVAFNDLEKEGFRPGKRIFVPNARRPAPTFSFSLRYGNNGYDYGYCTYYAAAKAGAPSGWGHAKTWAVNAARTPGWAISDIPVPGAIAQTTSMSYWGHVAIVEDVKQEDGQYFIKFSDMNNLAGWNRIGFTEEWQPASTFQKYIYQP